MWSSIVKAGSVRSLFKSPPVIGQRKYVKKLPDPWDLVTGKERFEVIQYAKGNKDPFLSKPMKRGPGTRECPNIILSVYNKRIVGCYCYEGAAYLTYFWVHEGFPRRCECNYWFVLERVDPSTFDC